jgi:hypothetical protein
MEALSHFGGAFFVYFTTSANLRVVTMQDEKNTLRAIELELDQNSREYLNKLTTEQQNTYVDIAHSHSLAAAVQAVKNDSISKPGFGVSGAVMGIGETNWAR